MEVAVVFGADAEKVLPVEGATAFVDPRLPELGVRVLAPAGQAAALLAARGCTEAPLADYDALRLELGVPDGSRDLPVEKALLLESGFDELNGVDWQKGCYMGQELTARTKYRGLIRKRLFPVRIDGALPAPGTSIEQRRPGSRRVPLGLGRSRACDAAARCRQGRPEADRGRRRHLAGNPRLDAASRDRRPLAGPLRPA